jgi:hypothetical protein
VAALLLKSIGSSWAQVHPLVLGRAHTLAYGTGGQDSPFEGGTARGSIYCSNNGRSGN